MNNKFYKQSGFTLIELMLYMSVSVIFVLGISIFLNMMLQSRTKGVSIAEVEQQGVQIAQLLDRTIPTALSVNSPTIGQTVSTLSLSIANPVENPTVFDLNSDIIRVTEGADPAIELNNSRIEASGLSFKNMSYVNGPTIIQYQFTLSHKNPANKQEYDYTKTFYGSTKLR